MKSLLTRHWFLLLVLSSPACMAANLDIPAPVCGWDISALRLLPALIGVAAVFGVTLRAFVLLQREVNRRILTEQRLATQLSFQQTMMEVVPYPLVAKDMNNRYIAVNRAFEEALGVRREDIVGRTSMEAAAWGDVNSRLLNDICVATLHTGERHEVEAEFIDDRGRSRYGLFWTGAFCASNGDRAGIVGTMIDITDIRDAEMRARRTEQRLHDVTRSLPAVVFQLRRESNGRYSLPYLNGDTRQLLGIDLAALADGPISVLHHVHVEDSARLLAEIETSSRTLRPVHTQFRVNVEGGTRWIRADLVARQEDEAGAVVWSGYWADATVDHARAEELARARDAAEAASRAKDDFLAMMSHEIRTPMNGVLGLVEVFENTPLNPDQSQMLGMIQDSASALLQILDDLLDYTKIEAGRLTIESTPFDLRELVDNAVGLLAGRAHEKGLRVRVDVAPDVAASQLFDSGIDRQRTFGAGGSYSIGAVTFGALWTQTRQDSYESNVASNIINNYEVNGRYALTPALSLGAAYTFTNAKFSTVAGESTHVRFHQFGLQTDYALSKRTDIYAEGVVQVASGLPEGVMPNAGISGVPNSSSSRQVLVTTGIRHRF